VTLAIDRGYTAPSLILTLTCVQGKTGCLVMKAGVLLFLSFAFLCFGLSACGQKGPLYLPQPLKPVPEAVQPEQPQQNQSQQSQPQQNQPASTNSESAPAMADPA
jgi:predicted small lipoprotein YifL